MKRNITLSIIIVLCLFLTGCKGKQVITTCTSSSKQINYTIKTKYIINSRKNMVESVNINQTIISKDKKILSDFKNQLDGQFSINKSLYGGYTYNIKVKNKKLVSKTIINYEKLNMKKFIKDNGAMKDYINKNNKFTLEGAKKLYESTGAKCE